MQVDNTAPVNLAIQYDQAAAQQTLQGISTVEQALEGLDKAAVQVGASAEHVAELINQQIAGGASLSEAVDAATASLKAEAQGLDQIGASADSATTRLQAFKAAQEDLSNTQPSVDEIVGGDDGGDSGGGFNVGALRGTGRALNQLGLGGIGRPIQQIGDVARVVGTLGDVAEAAGVSITASAVAFGSVEVALGPLLVALAPVAVAVGAAVVAFEAYSAAEQKHAEDVKSAIATLDTYYAAIQKGTTETIQKQIDVLNVDLSGKQQELNNINDQINQQRPTAANRPTGLIGGLADLGNTLGTGITDPIRSKVEPAFGELTTKATELQKGITDDQDKLKGLQEALHSASISANDAAEAEAKLQAARDQEADKAIQRATQDQQLIDSASSKSIENRIAAINTEKDAIDKQLASQQLSTDEVTKLTKQYIDLGQEEDDLTSKILPAVQAREAEKKAIDDTTKALEAGAKAVADFFKETNATINEFDTKSAAAKAKEAQSEADLSPGSVQDTQQRAQIRLRAQRQEEQTAQQSADRITDIRTKLGDDEARIQTDYNRQILDDQVNYQDNINKAVRDAQRTAQEDEIQHEQKLADIRATAQQSEQQALLDRNFLQIAKDEQNKQNAIQKEDTSYDDREQALQRHLANQEQDLAISLAQQEKQQQIAEQRKLEDAQTAADNQITQERTNEIRRQLAYQLSERQQLEDLTTAEGNKIQILRIGLANELALYQQYEQQRLAIALQTQTAILQQSAQQLANSVFGQNANNVIGGAENIFNGLMQGIFG